MKRFGLALGAAVVLVWSSPSRADYVSVVYTGTIVDGSATSPIDVGLLRNVIGRSFKEIFNFDLSQGTVVTAGATLDAHQSPLLPDPAFDATGLLGQATFILPQGAGTTPSPGIASDLPQFLYAYGDQTSHLSIGADGTVLSQVDGIFNQTTLSFNPKHPISSTFDAAFNIFGYPRADANTELDLSLRPTNVRVSFGRAPLSPVPLPPALPMFGAALLALWGSACLSRSRNA